MDGRVLTDERGFTMIELLAVVLSVGILAALALPAFLGQAHKAGDSDAGADVPSARSETGTIFTIDRNAAGHARTCTKPGAGGCRSDRSW